MITFVVMAISSAMTILSKAMVVVGVTVRDAVLLVVCFAMAARPTMFSWAVMMDCVGVPLGSAVKVVMAVVVVCGLVCMEASICCCGRVIGSARPVPLSPTTGIRNG